MGDGGGRSPAPDFPPSPEMARAEGRDTASGLAATRTAHNGVLAPPAVVFFGQTGEWQTGAWAAHGGEDRPACVSRLSPIAMRTSGISTWLHRPTVRANNGRVARSFPSAHSTATNTRKTAE